MTTDNNVQQMIALEYRRTARTRNWQTAYRMHTAGRENMAKEAPALARQEGWHDWRIVTETVAAL